MRKHSQEPFVGNYCTALTKAKFFAAVLERDVAAACAVRAKAAIDAE